MLIKMQIFISINKLVLEHSHVPIHVCIISGCFHTIEGSGSSRKQKTHKARIFARWHFTETFADPAH